MNMKKNVLSAAIIASMGVGSAQAVNISQTGTGEVGIIPFYSVRDVELSEGTTTNWETLISIVNTTAEVKALKVRFREAMNTQEVYDFNLYLSPYDVWTGKVQQSENGEGAEIETNDTSCTVPALTDANNDFLEYELSDVVESHEGYLNVGRTTEGYIEIFEMAVINDLAMQTAITHVGGTPANCGAVNNEFQDGDWDLLTDTQPSGGLKFAAALINVADGTEIGVPVTTLEAFSNAPIHFGTGTLAPTLDSASPPISVAMDNNGVNDSHQVWLDYWVGVDESPIDAVSAILMSRSVINEYTVNPAVAGSTSWIVTFPTKNPYVNQLVAEEPFTTPWSMTTGTACERTDTQYWDREEQQISSGILPSPHPADERMGLCWEANVVNIAGSDIFGGYWTDITVDAKFNSGWMEMSFNGNDLRDHAMTNDMSLRTYGGLPVIGFRASRLGNENVGVGAAYSVSDEHAYTREVLGGTLPNFWDDVMDFGASSM